MVEVQERYGEFKNEVSLWESKHDENEEGVDT